MKTICSLKNLFRLLFLSGAIVLAGCGDDDDDDDNNNDDDGAITSATGVVITLDWEPDGDGTNPDLDLDVNFGGSIFDSSSSVTPGESVSIDSDDSDGTYTVDVQYFSGTVSTDYTVTVSAGSQSVQFEGDFDANPSDEFDEAVVTIVKDGDTYTVN